jgi:hypothetical protein
MRGILLAAATLAAALVAGRPGYAQEMPGNRDRTPPSGMRHAPTTPQRDRALSFPELVNRTPTFAATLNPRPRSSARSDFDRDHACPPTVPGGYGYSYRPYTQNTVVVVGPSGYSLPPGTIVVGSTPTQSTVILGNGTAITVFNGYQGQYIPGASLDSPFGAAYGCPAYLQSQFAVRTVNPYVGGREQDGSVGSPSGAPTAGLETALRQLRAAWIDGDVRGLRALLDPDLSVAVFEDEQFAYSLKSRDFLALSEDAINRVATDELHFTDIRRRDDGLVNAYATQRYRLLGARDDGRSHVASLRYTLVNLDGAWKLSAVSLAPDSLSRRRPAAAGRALSPN